MEKILFVMIMLMAACSDPSTQETSEDVGGLGEQCYPNQTCNEELDCINDLCVAPDERGTLGKPCYANSTCNESLDCNIDGICIVPAICGDNTIDADEECDGFANEANCSGLGFYNGTVECTSDCTLDYSACNGKCGDGIIDTGEQCDGTNFGTTQCDIGTLGCNEDCTISMDCQTIVESSVGEDFECVVTQEGFVYCKGNNTYGQLGNGTNTSSDIWVRVLGLTDTAIVAPQMDPPCNDETGLGQIVFSKHMCALKTDGNVWCWGWNNAGQLGDNSTSNRNIPVVFSHITGPFDFIMVGCEATAVKVVGNSNWQFTWQ
jgi:hypothetical protein